MVDLAAEFVSVPEAAERTGINLRTLDRRLLRGEVEVFRDNRDRRRRLIRVTDLDRLAQPIPMQRLARHSDAGAA